MQGKLQGIVNIDDIIIMIILQVLTTNDIGCGKIGNFLLLGNNREWQNTEQIIFTSEVDVIKFI